MRVAPILLLTACTQSAAVLIDEDTAALADTGTPVADTAIGEGFTGGEPLAWTDEPTEQDWSAYDGAYARIVSPQAGSLIPIDGTTVFEVEVRSPEGALLVPDSVIWQSSIDPDFGSDAAGAAIYETGNVDAGVHTITTLVDLPNGVRLAHSIGGVKAQHSAAGTYAGLFSVDGSVNNIVITCTGAALLEVGDLGVSAEGDGDCLVSLLGFDVPMTWLFELENDAGVVSGTGGVDLLGFFTYDIPVTTGSVDPATGKMEVDFAGPIPFIGELSAFLEADKIAD